MTWAIFEPGVKEAALANLLGYLNNRMVSKRAPLSFMMQMLNGKVRRSIRGYTKPGDIGFSALEKRGAQRMGYFL